MEAVMPDKKTLARVREDQRDGKAPTTQAGEFVREEIDHIREGKHGARSAKQAIAIGLSKARRAGIELDPPKAGSTSEKTRQSAARDEAAGQGPRKPVSRARSRAITTVLKREGGAAASKPALAKQGHDAAQKRAPAQRSASARKAARTRKAENP
jgi:hypothetical protein